MNYAHRKRNLTFLFAFLISFISSLLIIFINNNDSTYQWLFLLPLSYTISTISCARLFNNIERSKVVLILVVGYFVKMVVSPLLFAMGGYNSFFWGYASMDNMNNAILFMVYEFFLVFLIATISLRNRDFFTCSEIKLGVYSGSRRLLFCVVLICLFVIFAYYYVPAIKNIYYFITDYQIGDLVGIRWDNETIVARGSIQRYIYSLFMFLWPLVRFLLPTVLIRLNYQKRGDTTKGVILSSITLIIPFMLLGGDNLAPFIASLFALLVIQKLYKNNGRKVLVVFGFVGIIAISGMVVGKLAALSGWRGATGVANLAQMLNSYIPGFDNTAIALRMNAPDKLSTMFRDLISGIPFIGSFINVSGDTLNDIYVRIANTGGQIVPWGCGLGYYFSYILSPLITAAFVWFLLYKEEKSNLATDFWTYYCNMIFAVYSAFSIIIYSTQIYMRFIWNIYLPITMIIWISSAREKNNNGKYHEQEI